MTPRTLSAVATWDECPSGSATSLLRRSMVVSPLAGSGWRGGGRLSTPPQAEGNFVLDESLVGHHFGSGLSAIPGLLAMEVAALGCTSLYAGSWGEWYKTTELAVEMGEPIHTGAGLRRNFCSWRSRFPYSCRYFVYQGRPRRNMPIQGLAGGSKNQTRNAS